MAMTVFEIEHWLAQFEDGDTLVGINESGLILEKVGDPEAYIEVGGIPEEGL